VTSSLHSIAVHKFGPMQKVYISVKNSRVLFFHGLKFVESALAVFMMNEGIDEWSIILRPITYKNGDPVKVAEHTQRGSEKE